jgi:hypothetical protein
MRAAGIIVTRREKYAVGSQRDIASFCYDVCEAQPVEFFIELKALTRFEERGYQIWGRAEWSETLSAG